MQHGVVHGSADVVGERTGAEIRGIVHVAGRGALAVDDALMHEFVDFKQVGADFGEFLQVAQDSADKTTGRLHRFDLFWSFQFNHASNPTSHALQRRRYLRRGLPKVKARTMATTPSTIRAQPPKRMSHAVELTGENSTMKPATIDNSA